MPPPEWKPRGTEWATIAPGVRFLLKPVTGELQAEVQARVAATIGNLQNGRADLEGLGFEDEDMGVLADLNVLAGLSVFASGVYHGEKLIEAWEGIDDPDTGEPVEVNPETIRAVLRIGTPEGGPALLMPFMAWLDRPRQPIAADMRRLRALAEWEQGGGLKHCEGCTQIDADCAQGGTDAGDRCPRLENAPRTPAGIAALTASRKAGAWRRAGISGTLTGLDYVACLAMYQGGDEGSFVRCLSAIEAGTLGATAEKESRD